MVLIYDIVLYIIYDNIIYIIFKIGVTGFDGDGYGGGPDGGSASKIAVSTRWWPFPDNNCDPAGVVDALCTDFHMNSLCI